MSSEAQMRRHYSAVYNFPNKLANLRGKIEAMRDEAEELGFRDEAAHLTALLTIANYGPRHEPKKIEWTPQETTQLKALWLEGLTAAEIGKRLGKTKPAVCAAARRNNLPRRRGAA
jgi:hypothetical protein